MRQVLVQIPVGIFLLQSYPLLLSEFPSVLAALSPHRYSENRKHGAAFFQRARVERMLRPRAALQDIFAVKATDRLPAPDTTHLLSMTDDTGMLQHAIFSLPNCLEGYTTDDNARALIVSILLDESSLGGRQNLSRRYLAFLWHAFHDKTARFRNFLRYDRQWQEEVGSEDSHGRALWALGTVLGHSEDPGLRGAAGRLFEAAVPAALTFTSPRAWAFRSGHAGISRLVPR